MCGKAPWRLITATTAGLHSFSSSIIIIIITPTGLFLSSVEASRVSHGEVGLPGELSSWVALPYFWPLMGWKRSKGAAPVGQEKRQLNPWCPNPAEEEAKGEALATPRAPEASPPPLQHETAGRRELFDP